jgi:hypothetical protein
VFENRLLRRIFGPVRDEVIGGLTKVDKEELRLRDEISLFYSVIIIDSMDTPYIHCSLQQVRYLMMA